MMVIIARIGRVLEVYWELLIFWDNGGTRVGWELVVGVFEGRGKFGSLLIWGV